MKPTRLLACRALLVLLLSSVVGCATTCDVREIVSASNAALIDAPVLLQPTSAAPAVAREARLKDAIKHMDRVIQQNLDQTILVNTIRVRQAMLLTMYHKFNAAREVWAKVDGDELPAPRDRALYHLREHLVWWYDKTRQNSYADGERKDADAALADFAEVCNRLERRSEARCYLEMMRAMIAAKRANAINTLGSAETKANVEQALAAGLQRLAAQLDASDHQWVIAHINGNETASDALLSTARARVWLREAVLLYRQVAADKNLSPRWKPNWVSTVPVP